MNSYIPAVEKLAADHIKEPVTIGSMKISILGGFSMNLDNVKLGTTQDVKIDRVDAVARAGVGVRGREGRPEHHVDGMNVAPEVLPRLSKWMDAAVADKNVQVDRIVMKNIKIESRASRFADFDADRIWARTGPSNAPGVSDGKLDVNLKPRNNEVDIAVSANKGWVLPDRRQARVHRFLRHAVASRNQIRVSEFRALSVRRCREGYGADQLGRAVVGRRRIEQ